MVMTKILLSVFCGILLYCGILFANVELVKDGISKTVIYVSSEVMDTKNVSHRRLRASVNDLAKYIEKMSGTRIEIITDRPESNNAIVPMLVGEYAQGIFGEPAKKSKYKQGWRLVISDKGVGFIGESDEAVSYAIYELVDRLGCRWYMPSEIGEFIPERKTISLREIDVSEVPVTISRNIPYADEDFKRRNRLGGIPYHAGQVLELIYLDKKKLQEHPDWNAEMEGKRSINERYCWANEELADALGDAVVNYIDKHKVSCVSLSPGDGIFFCECEKCRKLDVDDFYPPMGCISITDRMLYFYNRIAEKVVKKYPDIVIGFLAYAQYTLPPVREKLHPNLVPQITPIEICRAHSIEDTSCPSRQYLREKIINGWVKIAKTIAYSDYGYNLAEPCAPNPMMTKWVEDLSFIYSNDNIVIWNPETLPNFESCLPGLYLGVRMSWHTKANPKEIVNEFFANFYGNASVPMKKYWQLIDDAWTKTQEHAGCGFGYLRRFRPAVLKACRIFMNQAKELCRTDIEKRRVEIANECLKQFELFMKMREDFSKGRFENLDTDSRSWMETQVMLGKKYEKQYSFGYTAWASQTIGGKYFSIFYYGSYKDANRIANDFVILSPAIKNFKYRVDMETEGEKSGWYRPEYNDSDWKTTDVCVETWSTLGFDPYFGKMWYRKSVKIPEIPQGKRAYLWVSSMDGCVKLFVNGQQVPYVNNKGETIPEFSGYCEPVSFDVTSEIKSNKENQITILTNHNFLNELGTGGLLGPVVIYCEK